MTHKKYHPVLAILTLFVGILFPSNAFCAPGDLYETDLGSGTVFKFASDGTKTSFVSGLIAPTGLAFDGKGNVFISDTGSGTIVKVAPDGTQNVFAVIQNDGPIGIAFDASGNLYVGLFNGGVVLRITPA
ncbi:MAG: SMP-30/gluconolactonase/LRE family protein [Chthoniobacterales bacterium]